MVFGGMRESSTIKLSVKFHALYHIKLVSARRKVFLGSAKQKVDFSYNCLFKKNIICAPLKQNMGGQSQMVKMEVKHETKGNL